MEPELKLIAAAAIIKYPEQAELRVIHKTIDLAEVLDASRSRPANALEVLNVKPCDQNIVQLRQVLFDFWVSHSGDYIPA